MGVVEPPSMILEEERERTIKRLHQQLNEAQEELKNKNEKCGKLEQMQKSVDREIQELTASLFQVRCGIESTRGFPEHVVKLCVRLLVSKKIRKWGPLVALSNNLKL